MGADVETTWEQVRNVITGYGVEVLGAIVILIVGWWLAAAVDRAVRRSLGRFERVDATLRPLFASLARYLVLIVTVIAVLAQFGIETTSVIAVLGAAGLAIGLALQNTLQNVAAGVMLLLLRPFKVGDFIEAGGIAGTVDEISLFVSHMRTGDGVYVCVPNSALWNTTIRNFNRLPTRRVDLVVGVGYDDDIERAREVLLNLVGGDRRVLDDPAPVAMVSELASSAVNITVRGWVQREDYWAVRWDAIRGAKRVLDEAGISIPYPQSDVHLFRQEPDKAA